MDREESACAQTPGDGWAVAGGKDASRSPFSPVAVAGRRRAIGEGEAGLEAGTGRVPDGAQREQSARGEKLTERAPTQGLTAPATTGRVVLDEASARRSIRDAIVAAICTMAPLLQLNSGTSANKPHRSTQRDITIELT